LRSNTVHEGSERRKGAKERAGHMASKKSVWPEAYYKEGKFLEREEARKTRLTEGKLKLGQGGQRTVQTAFRP